MKQLYSVVLVLFCSFSFLAQDTETELKPYSFEIDYYHGTILEHNPDIAHLITDHPAGFSLAYNRKTYGFNEWERHYNYPDWGFTFIYQDMKNEYLGENYSIYGHYNWYFLNRNLMVRMAQGIGYNTNPYDAETNFINNAYGTHLLSTTFLKANYVRENLWKGVGFHAGFSIIHYSNANLRAPNNSTNTWAFNVGVNYLFDYEKFPEYISHEKFVKENPDERNPFREKWNYNVALRFGLNESDEIDQGQFPFFVVSAYASRRLNYKSTITYGVDAFFAKFLEEEIYFRSIAYPEDGLNGDEDWKRVGIFFGHELRFNKVAFVSQIGYYVYWPYEFENRIYNRLGLKRYFFDDKFFASITVKAHWAKAEGAEFGIGYRL
jgi:hypothetical protein